MAIRFKILNIIFLLTSFSLKAQDTYLVKTLDRVSRVNGYNFYNHLIYALTEPIAEGEYEPFEAKYGTSLDRLSFDEIDSLIDEAIKLDEDNWEDIWEYDWDLGGEPRKPSIHETIVFIELVYKLDNGGKLSEPQQVFFSAAEEGNPEKGSPVPIFSLPISELDRLGIQIWKHPENEADSMSMKNAFLEGRFAFENYYWTDAEGQFLKVKETHPWFSEISAIEESLNQELRKEVPVNPDLDPASFYRTSLVDVSYYLDDDYNIPFYSYNREFIDWIIEETFSGNLVAYDYQGNAITEEKFIEQTSYEILEEDWGYEAEWGDDPWEGTEEGPTFTRVSPPEMYFQIEYRSEEFADKVVKSIERLNLYVSADYNSSGIPFRVGSYDFSALKEHITSNPHYWHHPLNYRDSADFIAVIEQGRLRANAILAKDGRDVLYLFESRLSSMNPFEWSDRGKDVQWVMHDEKLLRDLPTESIGRNESWLESFLGAHWNDTTGLPPVQWNTDPANDVLVKFNYESYLYWDSVRNDILEKPEFRKQLYNDITTGKLTAYIRTDGEYNKVSISEAKESLEFTVYEGENEEEVTQVYTAIDLYLTEIQGEIILNGSEMETRSKYFGYGIPAELSLAGFCETKLWIKYPDLLNYLKGNKVKSLKSAGKMLKKDRYKKHLAYLEDVYGRYVYVSGDEETLPPAYYAEMVDQILSQKE